MILLLKILLQILAVGLAALIGGLDYVWHDKRTKKFKHARKLLFLFSIIFLVVSVVVTVYDDRENKRQQELTFGFLTGGNSYCYLTPGFIDENTIILILANEGDYPLYDVSIELTDEEGNKKIEGLEGKPLWDFLQQHRKVYHPGTIGISGRLLDTLDLTGRDKKAYYASLFTRFATFSETIKLAKVDGVWEMAYRVTKSPIKVKGGIEPEITVLKQIIAPRFPTINGEVDWR